MRNSIRIHGLIESELKKQLLFEVAIVENRTRTGATDFCRGDLVRFELCAENQSDVPFHRVAGFLSPTPFASFNNTRLDTLDLKPRERRIVASVLARITTTPSADASSDCLATLTVVAQARIEPIEIRESNRYLYAAPKRSVREASSSARRSIPLSDVTPEF